MFPITLMVSDPSKVAERMARAFGLKVTQDFGSFVELEFADGVLWLNTPQKPTKETQRGIVLQLDVDDVGAATERARSAGATILREPTEMDFGTESALAQVEGGPIVDLSRPLTP